jgi:hypothetical protein
MVGRRNPADRGGHACSRNEWLICTHGEDTSIRLLLGSAEVIAVDAIEIEIGTAIWSTKGKGEALINIGQAFRPPIKSGST